MHKKSNKMHYSDFCTTLKERRSLLRITQTDLAAISGVGVRTIKEIEGGKGNPSILTLLKIFDVLGMEMEAVIKRTNE